ncbi:MAG TPA: PKD domain-containing protein [Terracidiphilus sp.]|nr:PKD domain-containing protein [Terracidiphilus sp.]
MLLFFRAPRFAALTATVLALPITALAAVRVQPVNVPPEMRSTDFTVTVNGKAVDVAHAAASYSFVSFDFTGSVTVAITATQPGFWARGVDVQPWRLGIRPVRDGQTIRLKLEGPAKLSISRPGDFLNHATMLFLFAGAPPPPPPRLTPSMRYFQPGVYHQSLNPKSGETYYLAPGAYFFGSLNLWNVKNVKVMGRGTIVYDGPQDPGSDEGWMQKPDWHCIGSMESQHVEIEGLTCVVRSRTWSIQMKDSTGFVFDDLRVMGGNPGNANQDGMDWLGGGDTVVRNSFLRSSDDVFAMQGNWDGYSDEDMLRPGKDVQNILIENSELSTSISNVVRAGWPGKTFNSRNFTLRNSDILHGGIGACGQTFGLFGFWGADGAKGNHSNYTFQNLWINNWYSLAQIEQEEPALHGFTFRNIWALDQPPLAASTISGKVSGVTFDNVKYGARRVTDDAAMPLVIGENASPVRFSEPSGPVAEFSVDPPVIAPGQTVTFTAMNSPHTNFTWLFGDGIEAHGRKVKHRFEDSDGTQLDGRNGAGRFRVLLKVEDRQDRQDWAARGVVVVKNWHEATEHPGPQSAGLRWHLYPGAWTELPNLAREQSVFDGESPGIQVDSHGFTRYATAWDGYIDIPADGGYTFYLTARDGARVVIDGMEVAKTGPPFAQVCGSPGNAVRFSLGSLGLRAGTHRFHLEGLHSVSQGVPRLLWEGPGLQLTEVPPAAFSHPRQDSVGSQ